MTGLCPKVNYSHDVQVVNTDSNEPYLDMGQY